MTFTNLRYFIDMRVQLLKNYTINIFNHIYSLKFTNVKLFFIKYERYLKKHLGWQIFI